MRISMIALNEEKFVDPCISDMHDEDWIEEIIVIDGGSSDNTRFRLKQYPKVKVYVHPYPKYYHDAQIMQRNIQLTYHRIGEIFFVLDFDEKMSTGLRAFLRSINQKLQMPSDADLVGVSRISFESMREMGSPYAILDDNGWPVPAQQIGQYPDFQPRLIRRKVGMTWVNSPHHSLVAPEMKTVTFVNADILHYHGKFDARDRENIEILWAGTQARRKALGLTCDTFDATLSPELVKYSDPETWRGIWRDI